MLANMEILVWLLSLLLSVTAVAGFLRAVALRARGCRRIATDADRAAAEACAALDRLAKAGGSIASFDRLRQSWRGTRSMGPLMAAAAGPCRDAIGFQVDRATRQWEGSVNTICQFAARAATLMGLAGTCVGMIQALGAMAALQTPDPSAALPGISTALWATVAGIAIAVVSLAASKLLVEPARRRVADTLEEAAWYVHERAGRIPAVMPPGLAPAPPSSVEAAADLTSAGHEIIAPSGFRRNTRPPLQPFILGAQS